MKKVKLIEAEKKALKLFEEIEKREILRPGKSENEVNKEIFDLALELYGIEKYWHKRIIRSGKNTLLPYNENPPDLILEESDILFIDFGPVFEEWEADFGRTYVIGNDPYKIKLKNDIELAWYEAKEYFERQKKITGAELFYYAVELAKKYGWTFGGKMAGHIIGQFPHEKLDSDNYGLYVHPENHNDMLLPDKDGNRREWVLEMHFVDTEKQIGGFFEQLMT